MESKMKFVRVNNRLVLTEYGCNISSPISITLSDGSNSIHEIKITKIDSSDSIVSANNDNKYQFENDSIYLIEEEVNDGETVATGMFAVVKSVVTPVQPLAYMLETQKLWEALAALTMRLECDETYINTLMNGYTTE